MIQRVYLILFFFFTLSLAGIKAQRFHGGLTGGVNACQVDGDRFSGYNKLGLNFGVYTKTKLSRMWEAQVDLKYTGKGAVDPGTEVDPSVYELNLNYIEMPMVIRWHSSDMLAFEGGVAMASLLSAKWYDVNGLIPQEQIDPSFKNFEWAGIVGFNLALFEKMDFNIRYSYSILPVRNRPTGYYYGWLADKLGYTEGDYNNIFSISFYYQLSDDQ